MVGYCVNFPWMVLPETNQSSITPDVITICQMKWLCYSGTSPQTSTMMVPPLIPRLYNNGRLLRKLSIMILPETNLVKYYFRWNDYGTGVPAHYPVLWWFSHWYPDCTSMVGYCINFPWMVLPGTNQSNITSFAWTWGTSLLASATMVLPLIPRLYNNGWLRKISMNGSPWNKPVKHYFWWNDYVCKVTWTCV